jgi:protein-L-isoaspartate(D-aspartate) O-methyltransferase
MRERRRGAQVDRGGGTERSGSTERAGGTERRGRIGSHGTGVLAIVALLLALLASRLPWAEPTDLPTPTIVSTDLPTPTSTSAPGPSVEAASDDRLEERMSMVDHQIRRRGVTDQDVLEAMERVPRHEFVPDEYKAQAYADRPLPIGYGQTISQPYIVALMTELLQLKNTDRVLEIGTGSGYQAAILAEVVAEVYTVEIIEALAVEAKARLERLGYANIHTLHADGYYGWEEHAPYDAIIVTAAPDHIPQPLVQQLKDGARLVIPVGPPGGYQTLWQVSKSGEEVIKRNVTGVLFVPLTGEH